MTDDLVKRLKKLCPFHDNPHTVSKTLKEAADRIEQLERAALDLAQYVSRADMCFYAEPKTRKILNEIEEKTND